MIPPMPKRHDATCPGAFSHKKLALVMARRQRPPYGRRKDPYPESVSSQGVEPALEALKKHLSPGEDSLAPTLEVCSP